jgi:hypothetical protein
MPDDPVDGGTFRIQSKATGKQLALVGSSEGGVFRKNHIVPRDQGVVWEVEHVLQTGEEIGRLASNHERQVYAQKPNERYSQMWWLQDLGDGYWVLLNAATRLALDGNYTDIYTSNPHYGDFQRWGLFAAPPES